MHDGDTVLGDAPNGESWQTTTSAQPRDTTQRAANPALFHRDVGVLVKEGEDSIAYTEGGTGKGEVWVDQSVDRIRLSRGFESPCACCVRVCTDKSPVPGID